MLPGVKLDGMVGFIMLVEFGVVTQCMGEDVMLYANYVGEVIHDCVMKYNGSPNKNMGGAILCVWKDGEWGNATADGAFKSYREAIDTVNDHPKLKKLIADCKELQKLRPGFKCKVRKTPSWPRRWANLTNLTIHGPTCIFRTSLTPFSRKLHGGLHAGWIIEGAVGLVAGHKVIIMHALYIVIMYRKYTGVRETDFTVHG
jgi:hypothetical protein